MIRKIIKIDQDKCNGCALCASACHEGAIIMKDGKAFLAREDFCDGFGDCLPVCESGAISFIEKETLPFVNQGQKENEEEAEVKDFIRSQLNQWPCQLKLVPAYAPYFDEADLLISADCCSYSYPNFHNKFMKNRVTLIGCPKLDGTDYSLKIANILINNDIKSITVVKMEVPCCNGIERMVKKAVEISGKNFPVNVTIISTSGKIIE